MDSVIEQLKRLEETCEKCKEADELLFEKARELTTSIVRLYPTLNIYFYNTHYHVFKEILYKDGEEVCKNRNNILVFSKDLKNGLLEKIKC